MLALIEAVDGDISTQASRDILLAEATFGEFKKTPQLAARLADKAFDQIELGRWPSVRHVLVTQAIEGLSSPTLGPQIASKLRQWFPRWTSYGLEKTFEAIGIWPDDPAIEPVLWRGLHDEYYGAAQAAARTLARRYGPRPEMAERLSALIADPPNISAAAAALEALWRGWPLYPKTEQVLGAARESESPLIAITGVRGIVALGKQGDDDFSLLTEIAGRDDYTLNNLLDEALVAGWAGQEKLRQFALQAPEDERVRYVRRRRPDFGLLIEGFPGDRQVAELIARDFAKQHPHCVLDRDDFHLLAEHFKDDPIVVPAVESWAIKHRPDDGYTLSHAARVGATPKFKAALLRCVEEKHLAFWAASALVDLWGAADAEVNATLNKAAEQPIERRQNIAHVLPLVMADKARCRQLLLEIVSANEEERIRADFALEGLRVLGIDASDREAVDCVIARGYDEDRFVLGNEIREVIWTFYGDERVVELAKRELKRESGAIGTVAAVFSDSSAMRRLVLDAAVPLDLGIRSAIVEALSTRAVSDTESRALISTACREESGEIVIESSIKLAQINGDAGQIDPEYIGKVVSELDAIGPRMDARRQAALSALIVTKRLDLLKSEQFSDVHGIGMNKHRELLRLVASEWASIVEGLGGNDEALGALGVQRENFFDVFGNDVALSKAMTTFALSLVESSTKGVPAPAIRFVERVRPNSGLLREVCLSGLHYSGNTNWDTFSTAITAGEVLGRNFSSDKGLEDQLSRNLDQNPRDDGAIMGLCEGWPSSTALQTLRSRLTGQPQLPIPVAFKLMSTVTPEDRLVESLEWAVNQLGGDLWESPAHWIPSVIRRLKQDDAAYERMRKILLEKLSPGIKASFPRLLARARGLTGDLRSWCQSEALDDRDVLVGEVGFDLIAGQMRLVSHSLFDLLSGQDL